MNTKHLVKITNIIGLLSFILLIYWIFVFVMVQVFNLKIFRQHITELFGFSILGIIALMAGSLILNIMLNLTRIAERGEPQEHQRSLKKMGLLLLSIFPVLAGLLFLLDDFSLYRKKQLLIQSAQNIIQQYPKQTDFIAHYQFTPDYVQKTSKHLDLMSKLDSSIRDVSVLIPDTIDEKNVYLGFKDQNHYDFIQKNKPLEKRDFIFALNTSERQYLDQVFKQHLTTPKLIREHDNYRLYYPHQVNGKTVAVFLLSDYYAYGKIGS